MKEMIYDSRITDKKGNELPVVDNKKPKEQNYQSNDINENIKLQKEGNYRRISTQINNKFYNFNAY